MRPLSFLEMAIVVILAIGVLFFLTVGFPRQNSKSPCEIIEMSPKSGQELKDACKDIRKWYEKST